MPASIRVARRACDAVRGSTPYFVFREPAAPARSTATSTATAAENSAALRAPVEQVSPGARALDAAAGAAARRRRRADPGDLRAPAGVPACAAARRRRGAARRAPADPTLSSSRTCTGSTRPPPSSSGISARRTANRPWAICCNAPARARPASRREADAADRGDDHPARAAARRRGARKLVACSGRGSQLRRRRIEAIVRRAGGNPLFLQELVSAAGSEGTAELPETVDAVVGDAHRPARPARPGSSSAGPPCSGSSFDGRVIDDVLADGPPRRRPTPRSGTGSPSSSSATRYVAGGFRFRHALIRDAAYEGLPFRRRRELHQRVGEVYERRHAGSPEEVAELLSLHFSLRSDIERPGATRCSPGERAKEKFANVEAARFYRRALEVGDGRSRLEPAARGGACGEHWRRSALLRAASTTRRAHSRARAGSHRRPNRLR